MSIRTFACNKCEAKFQEIPVNGKQSSTIFCLNCKSEDVDQIAHLWERVNCPKKGSCAEKGNTNKKCC